MADATPTKPSKKGSSEPAVHCDGAKAKAKSKAVVHADAEDGHAGDATSPAPAHRPRLLRCACCGLAALAALAAVVILVLSLTVLKVRDPDLTMDSVTVERFRVGFADVPDGRPPLRINATLAAWIVIRNPNYASMRFGASTTEIFLDGVPTRWPRERAARRGVGAGRQPGARRHGRVRRQGRTGRGGGGAVRPRRGAAHQPHGHGRQSQRARRIVRAAHGPRGHAVPRRASCVRRGRRRRLSFMRRRVRSLMREEDATMCRCSARA